MLTRKARKARRNARNGGSGMVEILRQGERAYQSGLTLPDNPFPRGTEEAEIWQEGFVDARLAAWKERNR